MCVPPALAGSREVWSWKRAIVSQHCACDITCFLSLVCPSFGSRVVFLELVPGWALYRGLYEISQYAFRGALQDSQGITWSRLGDDNNGLPAVMIIMVVETLVFLLAAW